MLNELTWKQLAELRVFQAIEGSNEERQDTRFAYMLAVLCQKLGIESIPDDFYYFDECEDEGSEVQENPEQTAAIIASAVGALRN